MPPKHENPKDSGRIARAPYNFVPMSEKPFTRPDGAPTLNPDQSVYDSDRLTGWIDVALETRSPVYVRGPLTPDEHQRREHEDNNSDDRTPHLKKLRNKPDFFHTGDLDSPVIPGSSLRGMLRTVVEILGYGKFGPVPERPLVYRAVGDTSSHGEAYRRRLMYEEPGKKNWFTPLYRAGFIHNCPDGWYIQPAREVNGCTFARIMHRDIPERNRLTRVPGTRNAFELHVRVGPNDFQGVRGGFVHIRRPMVTSYASSTPGPNLEPAVLAESGSIPKKASEAVVFRPDFDAPRDETWLRIPDDPENPNGGRDLVTEYRDQLTPAQEKLLGKGGVLRDHQPVFYLVENGRLVFFGHTQMFRLTYQRSPQQFLPAAYSDEGLTDLAEAMFGKVRGTKGGQAGRVFVEDARLEPGQSDLWLPGGEVIPKILSTPKPTTFQHYLTQARPDTPQGKGLTTYNDRPNDTTLRGYKRYWPKGNAERESFEEKRENLRDQDKETQHTRMKPVRSGLKFQFRVRFENLLPLELGLLWWALALPANDGGDYCHQIGMGKPLGLGGVKLTPELHLLDPARRYRSLMTNEGWQQGEEPGDAAVFMRDQSVAQFETLMTRHLGQANMPFDQLERVQMLLTMMRWPGPDPENTRYMEIERWSADGRKENEYRGRPVLPDPLKVR